MLSSEPITDEELKDFHVAKSIQDKIREAKEEGLSSYSMKTDPELRQLFEQNREENERMGKLLWKLDKCFSKKEINAAFTWYEEEAGRQIKNRERFVTLMQTVQEFDELSDGLLSEIIKMYVLVKVAQHKK